MRHLLDAHTLIWALDDPSRLGRRARVILENPTNELTVSVATIWELSIKTGLGKLTLSLPFHHRDPFDRLLVAQCLVESIPLVSADTVFDQYGITSCIADAAWHTRRERGGRSGGGVRSPAR